MKRTAAFLFFMFAAVGVCAQGERSDRRPPEVTITSPAAQSNHNAFPSLRGTVADKPGLGDAGSEVPASGVAGVYVLVWSGDGMIWNGHEWTVGQSNDLSNYISAPTYGGQWALTAELPSGPKANRADPKNLVLDYGALVIARDQAGNTSYGVRVNFYVQPVQLLLFDANEMFTSVDLSDGHAPLSDADMEKLASLMSPSQKEIARLNQMLLSGQFVSSNGSAYAGFSNRFSAFRLKAVADGATKILAVVKGYTPGTVSFGREDNPSFDWADCEQTIRIPHYSSVNTMGAVPGAGPITLTSYRSVRFCTSGPTDGDRLTTVAGESAPLEVTAYRRSENEYYWFALYTVPTEIPSVYPNSLQGHLTAITATYTATSAQARDGQHQPVKSPLFLLRPPVLLVHGLNSKSDAWGEGKEHEGLADNSVLEDQGFDVHLADYRQTSGASFDANRQVLGERSSIFGTGIKDILRQYRSYGTAISSVDVVGHSMGGILARVFYQTLDESHEYYVADNMRKGYIRRLITIGTPHLGSAAANLLIKMTADNDVCASSLTLLEDNLDAVADLQIGSVALRRIRETPIRSHAIVGTTEDVEGFIKLLYSVGRKCRFFLGSSDLIDFRNTDSFRKTMCAGQPCDLIVQEVSQRGGLSEPYVTTIPNTNHLQEIGSVEIRKRVAELLLGSEEAFAPGFPAVASLGEPPVFPPDKKKGVGGKTARQQPAATRQQSARASVQQSTGASVASLKLGHAQSGSSESSSAVGQPASRNAKTVSSSDAHPAQSGATLSMPESFRVFKGGRLFSMEVPEFWRESAGQGTVTFAPEDGAGASGVTRGVVVGVVASQGVRKGSSEELLHSILRDNPHLSVEGAVVKGTIGGLEAQAIRLTGVSPLTKRQEIVVYYFVTLSDGRLFYLLNVFPQAEETLLSQTFRRLIGSLRFDN